MWDGGPACLPLPLRLLLQSHPNPLAKPLISRRARCARGTLDSATSRMLFLHLPTRHPSTYPELEISPLVQAAALLGVGLLFQGSCHRSVRALSSASLLGAILGPGLRRSCGGQRLCYPCCVLV